MTLTSSPSRLLSTAALFGIASVIMTKFGVNYYLSGLHSYGGGEAPPIPSGVYIAIAVVIIVIAAASFSDRKELKKVK